MFFIILHTMKKNHYHHVVCEELVHAHYMILHIQYIQIVTLYSIL
jgi:hypothetical protein